VYEALAAEWHREGRTVPGERDWEWADLTTRPIWRQENMQESRAAATAQDSRGQMGKPPALTAPSTSRR
jgi:hypothetical protein